MIADNIFGQSSDSVAYYAREADRLARGPQAYGGNAALLELRCFRYYNPASFSWVMDPEGKKRWLAPKMFRVSAILDVLADSGKPTTMKAIAEQAMCCVSTVSRAVQKLQAWNLYAIDVKRGRGGGITVRKRRVGDHLKHYAAAAWRRIRSWINVASRSSETRKGRESTEEGMDATFSWERRVEYAGERVRDGSWSVDYARAVAGGARERRTEADLADERATAWALEVIAERARLDREDPDWDLVLEQARERWLS